MENNRKKRYGYPAIITVVFFAILYIVTLIPEDSPGLHTMPLFFQGMLWVLVYFGMIAAAIRSSSFGWDL